jgi:hypothetical protein
VSIRSVVGTLLLVVLLIAMLLGYVVVYTYDVFFILSIIGIVVLIVLSVQSIISESGLIKKALDEYSNDTTLDTCPDYWQATNTINGINCSNTYKSLIIGKKVDPTGVNGVPAATSTTVVDSDNLNIKSLEEMDPMLKCEMTTDYAWTQARNKCRNTIS